MRLLTKEAQNLSELNYPRPYPRFKLDPKAENVKVQFIDEVITFCFQKKINSVFTVEINDMQSNLSDNGG